MIPITPDYLPEQAGTYLVKTTSTYGKTITREHFLQTQVYLHKNPKGEMEYSIDVKNQIPIAISSKPLF